LESASMAALAKGQLVPLTHAFPLAEAAEAHRALESRGTVGKVVLVS
jgi:NADPH:quinone reductase